MFDRNGDKRVSARELASVILQSIGGNEGKESYISEDELMKMIQESDLQATKNAQNPGSAMDFDDFLSMMHDRLQAVDVQEEVIEAFRIFDKERTGFVQVDDVKKILEKMGDGQVTKEEVNEILREIDPEGTQAFKYEEYVK